MIPLKRPKQVINSSIYLISKQGTAQVSFKDLVAKTSTFYDYNAVYPIFFNIFDEEKTNKLMRYITEGSMIMVDFDKEKAYKLQDKPVDYLKTFWKTAGTVAAVQNEVAKEKFELSNEPEDINLRILTKYDSEEI